MRLASLLTLFVLAPALHAQAVPDTTAPWRYYPLEVGNRWEYVGEVFSFYAAERRTVVRDTTIGGMRYAVVRWQGFRPASGGWATTEIQRLVARFDTATASVRSFGPTGERDLFGCRLDLPLPGGTCNGDGPFFQYGVTPQTTVAVGSDVLTTSVRWLDGLVPGPTLAAGIGVVEQGCEGACGGIRLTYARVAGEETGEPIAGLPDVPDPTPPEDYYPLDVGNEWIYYESDPFFNSEVYRRRQIVREDVVAGQRYAVEQACSYDLRASAPTWTCAGERLVRFDPTTASVVSRNVNGEVVEICNLGADFESTGPCRYVDFGTGPVVIGGTAYPVARVKAPATVADPGPPPFAAGIGPLEQELTGPLSVSRFEFARVRGVEYGVRPVSAESSAGPRAVLTLVVSPNPTVGPLALTFTLPEAQTVAMEAFDALGRRVWRQDVPLGAGAQTLAADTSAWAPGVYVIRATAGRATATSRIVRR